MALPSSTFYQHIRTIRICRTTKSFECLYIFRVPIVRVFLHIAVHIIQAP